MLFSQIIAFKKSQLPKIFTHKRMPSSISTTTCMLLLLFEQCFIIHVGFGDLHSKGSLIAHKRGCGWW